jgi:hypothetical protein
MKPLKFKNYIKHILLYNLIGIFGLFQSCCNYDTIEAKVYLGFK